MCKVRCWDHLLLLDQNVVAHKLVCELAEYLGFYFYKYNHKKIFI